MNKYAILFGTGLGGDNDARLMARILKKNGFNSKDIHIKTNRKATRENLFEEIEWLRSKDNVDATLVFLFSGHGLREYIKLDEGLVSSAELDEQLGDLQSQKILICIQACYSGNMVDDLEAPNRIVISSSMPDEASYSFQNLTAWGRYFLKEALLRKMADYDNDGEVSIQDAYYYIPESRRGVMSDLYFEPMFL